MERLKIKVHITFIIFACLLIYFGQGFLFINYVLVIFLHELSHALVARKLGYNIKSIKLIPFGISLNLASCKMEAGDEIKIAIAGPLCNLVLCLFCFALWWLIPESYNFTYLFGYANFITCVFNLLPAFPLDGGRVFRGFIKLKSNENDAIKYCKIVNVILAILLLIMFIMSLFIKPNLTYLFVIFCVLSGLSTKNIEDKYTFINFSSVKKHKKVVKIKNLRVDDNERLYKICRYLDNFSYLNLYVYSSKENFVKIISENEYLLMLEKYPASITFREVLKLNKGTF